MFAVLQVRINETLQNLVARKFADVKAAHQAAVKSAKAKGDSILENETLQLHTTGMRLTETNLVRVALMWGLTQLNPDKLLKLLSESDVAVSPGRPRGT